MAENSIANGAPQEQSTVVREVTILAPIDRVWRAISRVPEFCRWSGVSTAVDRFVPGAHVRMISGHRGREGSVYSIHVEELAEPHAFSWRWHAAMPEDEDNAQEPMTRVAFTLHETDGATVVRVTEEGFDALPAEKRARALHDRSAGWDAQLRALLTYLGG